MRAYKLWFRSGRWCRVETNSITDAIKQALFSLMEKEENIVLVVEV